MQLSGWRRRRRGRGEPPFKDTRTPSPPRRRVCLRGQAQHGARGDEERNIMFIVSIGLDFISQREPTRKHRDAFGE